MGTLVGLKSMYNDFHFLHNTMDSIWPYHAFFTHLKPINWRYPSTSIQFLISDHQNVEMIAIIVSKIYERMLIIPTTIEVNRINSQKIL